MKRLATVILLALAASSVASPPAHAQSKKPDRWTAGETFRLKGYDVTLSVPVLVAQAKPKEYFCIPTAALLANGDLVVSMSAHADVVTYPNRGAHSFSKDGGLTWDRPVANISPGATHLRLPAGDEYILTVLPRSHGSRERQEGYGDRGSVQSDPKGQAGNGAG